jgi:hypothetical protein
MRGYAADAMSKTEILTELPKLAPTERREIVLHLRRTASRGLGFELEDDADRRAAERFAMLDAMEN